MPATTASTCEGTGVRGASTETKVLAAENKGDGVKSGHREVSLGEAVEEVWGSQNSQSV